MNKISEELFVSKLMKIDADYNSISAKRIYEQLSNSDSDIQFAALRWVESNIEPNFEKIEGWDIHRMKSELGMNTLAAILTVDWLRKDPQKALSAIKEGIK